MVPKSVCPSHDELRMFAVGSLSADRYRSVGGHLDTCDSCQTVLGDFDDTADVLVEELRKPGACDDDPGIGELTAWLQKAAVRNQWGLSVRGDERTHDPTVFGELPVPESLGGYEIERRLGYGGMGTVYKAFHPTMERTVALKALPSDRFHHTDAAVRFQREIKATARLVHPNIVQAYDAGEDNGTHYLVMDYIEGEDLSRLVDRLGPLPVADACEIIRQAALGLQHAHEQGLVHRDIKPSNLMLTVEGSMSTTGELKSKDDVESAISNQKSANVKVLDFGLALFSE